MPYYHYLRQDFPDLQARNYVIRKILQLKKQLKEEVPAKHPEDSLTIATWNIRDFGKANRRGFGSRTKDSHYYIAEIISSFDFVAVQEINELDEWNKVMKILGPDWNYIATDITHTGLGGNGERLCFVYDTRKVWFKNIAGEIVLPQNMLISDSEITNSSNPLIDGKQFRRTPFLVSFQSGWLKFDICTVHIYYGEGKSGLSQRIQEIRAIGKYLSKKADEVLKKEGRATILLGDFNIIRPDHETMKALEENGFIIPKNIKSRKTNVIETMHYDQIAFKSDHEMIEFVDNANHSGVFKVFTSVFRNTKEDFEFYKPELLKSANGKKLTGDDALREYYHKKWRTYQMSDHNVLWARVNSNKSEEYLRKLGEVK